MRILIIVEFFNKLHFFLCIAEALKANGHTVIFYSKSLHILHSVKKYGFENSAYLPKEKVDKVLFWNGTSSVEKEIICEAETTCWFFENGYWPSETLQLNREGVNNEADYAKLDIEEKKVFSYPVNSQISRDFRLPESPKISLIYYVAELFSRAKSHGVSMVVINLCKILRKKYAAFKQRIPKQHEKIDKKYIFFPLQVNSDTQLRFNSPYKSMSQVLGLIKKQLADNECVVIKSHPMEFENVIGIKSKNIMFLTNIDLEHLMAGAEFVITINSSVGMQALEQHKKVLHLGDSFYDNFPGVVKCNLLTDNLMEKVEKLRSTTVDWDASDELITHFKHTIFLKGNWRNPNCHFIASIVARII